MISPVKTRLHLLILLKQFISWGLRMQILKPMGTFSFKSPQLAVKEVRDGEGREEKKGRGKRGKKRDGGRKEGPSFPLISSFHEMAQVSVDRTGVNGGLSLC